MWIKVLKWFFFSFLLSLLPFGLSALILSTRDIPMTGGYSWSHFWEHGELCLISITLVAAGIGDVASSKMERSKTVKIALICWALVFLLAATAWYTQVSSCLMLGEHYNITLIREKTPYLLIFSAIIGLACVLLSKEV